MKEQTKDPSTNETPLESYLLNLESYINHELENFENSEGEPVNFSAFSEMKRKSVCKLESKQKRPQILLELNGAEFAIEELIANEILPEIVEDLSAAASECASTSGFLPGLAYGDPFFQEIAFNRFLQLHFSK